MVEAGEQGEPYIHYIIGECLFSSLKYFFKFFLDVLPLIPVSHVVLMRVSNWYSKRIFQ